MNSYYVSVFFSGICMLLHSTGLPTEFLLVNAREARYARNTPKPMIPEHVAFLRTFASNVPKNSPRQPTFVRFDKEDNQNVAYFLLESNESLNIEVKDPVSPYDTLKLDESMREIPAISNLCTPVFEKCKIKAPPWDATSVQPHVGTISAALPSDKPSTLSGHQNGEPVLLPQAMRLDMVTREKGVWFRAKEHADRDIHLVREDTEKISVQIANYPWKDLFTRVDYQVGHVGADYHFERNYDLFDGITGAPPIPIPAGEKTLASHKSLTKGVMPLWMFDPNGSNCPPSQSNYP